MSVKVLLTGLLIATMLYIYVKQSRLMFQHDIKIARILVICLLVVAALENTPLSWPLYYLRVDSTRFALSIYFIFFWTLAILAFWKILAGCQKDAFFKIDGHAGQSLKEKVRDIILEAVEKNEETEEFRIFLKTHFSDEEVESVRKECIFTCRDRPIVNEHFAPLEKLRVIAEQLEKQ